MADNTTTYNLKVETEQDKVDKFAASLDNVSEKSSKVGQMLNSTFGQIGLYAAGFNQIKEAVENVIGIVDGAIHKVEAFIETNAKLAHEVLQINTLFEFKGGEHGSKVLREAREELERLGFSDDQAIAVMRQLSRHMDPERANEMAMKIADVSAALALTDGEITKLARSLAMVSFKDVLKSEKDLVKVRDLFPDSETVDDILKSLSDKTGKSIEQLRSDFKHKKIRFGDIIDLATNGTEGMAENAMLRDPQKQLQAIENINHELDESRAVEFAAGLDSALSRLRDSFNSLVGPGTWFGDFLRGFSLGIGKQVKAIIDDISHALEELSIAFDASAGNGKMMGESVADVLYPITWAIELIIHTIQTLIETMDALVIIGAWSLGQLAWAWDQAVNGIAKAIEYIVGKVAPFIDIGKQFVMGIVKGIKDVGADIGKALESVINHALDYVRGKTKTHSPSDLFADDLGAPLTQGIGKGALREGPKVSADIANMVGEMASIPVDRSVSSTTHVASSPEFHFHFANASDMSQQEKDGWMKSAYDAFISHSETTNATKLYGGL